MAMNTTRVATVDRLLAAFHLIMALFWGSVLHASPAAPWICAAHAAGCAVPWLFSHCTRLSRPVVLLRRAYPLVLLLVFWTEIDALRRALNYTGHDPFIRALDSRVFGTALHAVWPASMPSLWLSELLHFAYFAYYFAIAVPLIVLALQNRAAALREAEFRLLLTFTACFTAYALFPVDGPHRFELFFAGPGSDGVFYRIVHAVNDAGGSLGAAFPSSHAAGAVTVAYLGWLFFSRPAALLMSVHAFAIVLATFYTQYHYAIDAAAGTAFALTLQLFVAPLLLHSPARTAGSQRAAPRLPALPTGWPDRPAGVRP